MEHRSAEPPKGPTGPPPSWRPPPPPAPRIAAEPPRATPSRPGARRAAPKPSTALALLARAEPAKVWVAEKWAAARSSTATRSTPGSSKTPPTWRRWGKVTAKVALVGFLAIALIGSVTAIVAYNRIKVPDPNAAFEVETSFVYYGNGKTELGRYQDGDQNRIKLDADEIPETVKHAVVAAEDRTFFENSGDRKSTRQNSSHPQQSRMPSSA